jgi:hypothetical protein
MILAVGLWLKCFNVYLPHLLVYLVQHSNASHRKVCFRGIHVLFTFTTCIQAFNSMIYIHIADSPCTHQLMETLTIFLVFQDEFLPRSVLCGKKGSCGDRSLTCVYLFNANKCIIHTEYRMFRLAWFDGYGNTHSAGFRISFYTEKGICTCFPSQLNWI